MVQWCSGKAEVSVPPVLLQLPSRLHSQKCTLGLFATLSGAACLSLSLLACDILATGRQIENVRTILSRRLFSGFISDRKIHSVALYTYVKVSSTALLMLYWVFQCRRWKASGNSTVANFNQTTMKIAVQMICMPLKALTNVVCKSNETSHTIYIVYFKDLRMERCLFCFISPVVLSCHCSEHSFIEKPFVVFCRIYDTYVKVLHSVVSYHFLYYHYYYLQTTTCLGVQISNFKLHWESVVSLSRQNKAVLSELKYCNDN